MNAEPRIHLLLIEDDERLAELTQIYLARQDLLVTQVATGEEGLAELRRTRFDVVLLDVMLPGLNGIQVCQQLRQFSDVPVIMITARGEEADRVLGLEIGADDYVPKPYSPRELLARIRAAVRRARGQSGPGVGEPLTLDGLLLDPGRHEATLDGIALELTPYEFALLMALVQRAGHVLSREQLMELAKGSAEESFDRSIDVHVSRLRQKLGDDPRHPRRIKTVRGVGYQFMTGVGE